MSQINHILKTGAIAGVMAAALSAHANLLVNGSFEDPSLRASSLAQYTDGQTIGAGWTVFNATTGPVYLISNGYDSSIPNAPDGTQLIDLYGGDIQQGVTLTAGKYNLSFEQSAYASGSTTNNYGNVSYDVVGASGSVFGGLQNSTVGGGMWVAVSTSFTVTTSGAFNLSFQQLNPGPGLVDNVILTSAQAVPEPSSVLILAGLAGSVFLLRRKS